MRELLGHLAALDHGAGQQLRVIELFDRLIEAGTGIERLLREATVLCQAPTGYHNGRRGYRSLISGELQRLDVPPSSIQRLTVPVGECGTAWLERSGRVHANDDMVLERLALALNVAETRYVERARVGSAVEVLLNPPHEEEERREACLVACSRLGFEPQEQLRAVALPLAFTWSTVWPSTLSATPWGRARAFIVRGEVTWSQRCGIGVSAPALGLGRSWRSATIALRLSDRDGPFAAEDLGAMLPLLEGTTGQGNRHPDVERVDAVLRGAWTLPALQRIAAGESLRAVAETSELHHSTVAARIPRLVEDLGFDPQMPMGRTRLYLAILIHRLRTG